MLRILKRVVGRFLNLDVAYLLFCFMCLFIVMCFTVSSCHQERCIDSGALRCDGNTIEVCGSDRRLYKAIDCDTITPGDWYCGISDDSDRITTCIRDSEE